MPKIAYVTKNFRADSIALIEKINQVIADYNAQGYSLTLRQVYYQMVARDIIPNNERSYKNLGSLINDARLAGLIDWNAIEDRTRNLRGRSHWSKPNEVIESAAPAIIWTSGKVKKIMWKFGWRKTPLWELSGRFAKNWT